MNGHQHMTPKQYLTYVKKRDDGRALRNKKKFRERTA